MASLLSISPDVENIFSEGDGGVLHSGSEQTSPFLPIPPVENDHPIENAEIKAPENEDFLLNHHRRMVSQTDR